MTAPTVADNVRSIDGIDDAELRTSLEVAGWNRELPAIQDEHGVVIVGHRRLKIAAEEGVEPVIKVVTFGTGPEAEAERVRLAVVSNIGAAPMTKADRKRLAVRLYGDGSGLTMEALAGILGVSKATISGDLGNCSTPEQLKTRPKTDTNPKGAGRRKSSPEARGHLSPDAARQKGAARRDWDAAQGKRPGPSTLDELRYAYANKINVEGASIDEEVRLLREEHKTLIPVRRAASTPVRDLAGGDVTPRFREARR